MPFIENNQTSELSLYFQWKVYIIPSFCLLPFLISEILIKKKSLLQVSALVAAV